MLTTTTFGLKKPQTTDARTALRTAISDNADTLETIFGRLAYSTIIATSETSASASFGLLTTPDRCQSVVVPAGAQVRIAYQALWKSFNNNAADAAIFIGANQLKIAKSATNPVVQQVSTTGSFFRPLHTQARGLMTDTGTVSSDTGVSVTTGQILGSLDAAGLELSSGAVTVFGLAAGTYDISVQFRVASAGPVTVKDRRLSVEVLPA